MGIAVTPTLPLRELQMAKLRMSPRLLNEQVAEPGIQIGQFRAHFLTTQPNHTAFLESAASPKKLSGGSLPPEKAEIIRSQVVVFEI